MVIENTPEFWEKFYQEEEILKRAKVLLKTDNPVKALRKLIEENQILEQKIKTIEDVISTKNI